MAVEKVGTDGENERRIGEASKKGRKKGGWLECRDSHAAVIGANIGAEAGKLGRAGQVKLELAPLLSHRSSSEEEKKKKSACAAKQAPNGREENERKRSLRFNKRANEWTREAAGQVNGGLLSLSLAHSKKWQHERVVHSLVESNY